MTYRRVQQLSSFGRNLMCAGFCLTGGLVHWAIALFVGLLLMVLLKILLKPKSFWQRLTLAQSLRILGFDLCLVGGCTIFGLLLNQLMGQSMLPFWSGIALSFGGLAVHRLVWSSAKASEFEKILTEIIEERAKSSLDRVTFGDLVAEYDRRVGNV